MSEVFIKNIKAVLALIVAITLSVVGITKYLDDRASTLFYAKNRGEVLEERVKVIEEQGRRMDQKLEDIRSSQQEVIIQLRLMDERLKDR